MIGTWWAMACRTWWRTAGSLDATRPSRVTSTSSSGNRETNPEWARLAASTPPLSSPYFLISPKTNAVVLCRCCAASTRRITLSIGFIRTTCLRPARTRLPADAARKHEAADQPAGNDARPSTPPSSHGAARRRCHRHPAAHPLSLGTPTALAAWSGTEEIVVDVLLSLVAEKGDDVPQARAPCL